MPRGHLWGSPRPLWLRTSHTSRKRGGPAGAPGVCGPGSGATAGEPRRGFCLKAVAPHTATLGTRQVCPGHFAASCVLLRKACECDSYPGHLGCPPSLGGGCRGSEGRGRSRPQHQARCLGERGEPGPSPVSPPLTGPLCSVCVNRFGCRPVMLTGGLLASLGMVAASFCRSVIQLYLTTGVITGEWSPSGSGAGCGPLGPLRQGASAWAARVLGWCAQNRASGTGSCGRPPRPGAGLSPVPQWSPLACQWARGDAHPKPRGRGPGWAGMTPLPPVPPAGLGLALNFQPSLIMLNRYFNKRRPMANGLAAAGSPVFLCALSPLGQLLQDRYGWRGGFLILGGLLLNCCVCAALMRPLRAPGPVPGPAPQRPPRRLLDLSVFRDRGFVIYAVAASIMVLGLFVPPVFVVSYAKDLGVPDGQAAFLLTVLGFIDIFARPTAGFITGLEKVRPYSVYLFSFSMFFNGFTDLTGSTASDYGGLVVFCIFFGISYGMVGALQFEVLMAIVGTQKFSSAIGLVLLLEAVAVLIGPPSGGGCWDAGVSEPAGGGGAHHWRALCCRDPAGEQQVSGANPGRARLPGQRLPCRGIPRAVPLHLGQPRAEVGVGFGYVGLLLFFVKAEKILGCRLGRHPGLGLSSRLCRPPPMGPRERHCPGALLGP